MTTRTGTCDCGAVAERELATGQFAAMINGLPLVCDSCAALADAAAREAEALEQESRHREKVAAALRALPARLRDVRLDELDRVGCELAIDAATRWADQDLAGLVLLGPFGVGKTTIAAGAVRAYVDHDPARAPRWLSAALVLNHLTRAFGDPLREEMIGALGNMDRRALVIDDIDKIRPSAFAAESLFLAIDQSLTEGRSLLITTNWLPSQFARQWPKPYGDAIASRLAGYCEVHRLTGSDRRLALRAVA